MSLQLSPPPAPALATAAHPSHDLALKLAVLFVTDVDFTFWSLVVFLGGTVPPDFGAGRTGALGDGYVFSVPSATPAQCRQPRLEKQGIGQNSIKNDPATLAATPV